MAKQNPESTHEPAEPQSVESGLLDVVIIGSGPAALSAALYLARAGLKTVVFERGEIGGELARIAKISNYPGFDGAGRELATKFRAQAEQAGAEIRYGECLDIRPTKIFPSTSDAGLSASQAASPDSCANSRVGRSSRPSTGLQAFEFQIDDEVVRARAGLVATGSEPRPLGFTINPPVSYCALCDGELARGKDIAVVGGANSAVQESLYLAPLVKHLTLISHSALKADSHLQECLRTCTNVEIRENLEPTPKLLNQYDYVFVFIGTKPATSFLSHLGEQKILEKSTKLAKLFRVELEVSETLKLLDNEGYILTGHSKRRSEHETAYSGLFAAGDVRSGAVKQVATSVGDGVAAATEIINFLRKKH